MKLQIVLMDEGGKDLIPSHGIITLPCLSCVIMIMKIIINCLQRHGMHGLEVNFNFNWLVSASSLLDLR